MRVAIIGTGVAGLTAAHVLAPRHDVTVFEADRRPGGHANTVRVSDPRAGDLWIDTGFIVYNERNYPSFTRLLAALGVPTQPATMGLSISTPDGSFEFAGTRAGLFAQRSNALRPRFLRMLRDQLRFNREARAMIGRAGTPSVAQFARDSGYSDWFLERILVPEVSAVWSSDPAAVEEFPVGFLAEFLDNHGQLRLTGRPRWRTVCGGSGRYVDAIARGLGPRLRLGTPVRTVERLPGAGVRVVAEGHAAELFDEVVIATHSDQALAMLSDPTEAEREVLDAIRYVANDVVLHTDAGLMPTRRRAWASWNFHLTDGATLPTMSYWMNGLHRFDAARDYFVTLNRASDIDPARVLERFEYAHPVMDHRVVAAQGRWGEISGSDRIHFCGAYWRWGFHEDGCWSAIRACERVGAERAVRPAAVEAIAA
jgi:predicted NAD/FAD-binding protein